MRAQIIVLLLTIVFIGVAGAHVPPDPTNIQNTAGYYWVNHTWEPGTVGATNWYLVAGENTGVFNGYNWSGSTWQADSAIVSGLANVGTRSAPCTFQMNDVTCLISGDYNGKFTGYNWSGSAWQADSAIVSGLPDPGYLTTPSVFQRDGTYYIFYGSGNHNLVGYNWSGSTWQHDTNIALADTNCAPCAFQKDGTWYLISGRASGDFNGFTWSGSAWQADSAIVSGLIDVGDSSSPNVFQRDGVWYLVAGEKDGGFNGYNWSGSAWQADSAIVSGLIDVGTYSTPTIFNIVDADTPESTDSYNISVNGVWHNGTISPYYKDSHAPSAWQNITVFAYNDSGDVSVGSISQNTQVPAPMDTSGMLPDSNIRIDPHPDHISFYTNSAYITCNYTNREPASVTIKFEVYNPADNSSDVVHDYGEFASDTIDEFNIQNSYFTTVGWYRVSMYDIDGDILCYYEIAVRDHTHINYEALHGSMRFTDADSVPSVSFIENIAGRAQTWTTTTISLTHSVVLWEYDSDWTMADGGNYTHIDHTNTSGNITNWVLSQTYDLDRYYRMILYSHDGEVLDTHCVKAVVPTSNVVEVRAEDSQTGIAIPVFTANMNGETLNVLNGIARFTNVTNGAHIVTVTADNYHDTQKTVYMANSYINTTVYMLTYSPFAPPHKDVEFVVSSIFNKRYTNVAVTAKYLTTNGENATMSGATDSTGSITFSMVATTLYTISFINDTQGVNKTITVHPKDTRYVIIIGTGGKWTEYEDRPMDSIHITVKKSVINDTHAYINVTYMDDTNGTLALVAWINQTNPHDPRNPTNIASHTFTGDLNDTNHSFIMSDYTGQGYQVRVWHDHNQFGTFYDRSVRFAGMLIDLGLPTAFYFWFAIGTLFFVAAFFGATTTSVGSIIVCALGWVFLAIGWLACLGIFGPISLTLASVYAVANNLITRHHRGGFA